MTRNRIAKTLASLWAVALCATAGAQQQPVDTGRALDASPLVGSGGQNQAVTSPRFSSQLYISGQVSGLSGFRGQVPYRAPNQLGLSLPSDALSDFNRRSVGVQDVLRGNTYRPQPYLAPSQTVLGLRGIIGGQALPGSNVPALGAVPLSPTAGAYPEVTAPYLLRPSPLAIRPELPIDQTLVPRALAVEQPFEGRRDLSVWRMGEPQGQKEPSEAMRILLPVDLRIDTAVRAQAEPTAPGLPPPGEGLLAPGVAQAAPGTTPDNQEVMSDLLYHLRQNQFPQGQAPPARRPGGVGPQSPEAPGTTASPQKPAPARPESSAYVEIKDGRVVIHQLAGPAGGAYTKYMNRGGALLKDGEYDDASRQFGYAIGIDSRDPLARLGRGLSYFAAGEGLSAATDFCKAFQILPPIMETRLDYGRMMNPKAFKERLGQLDTELAKTDQVVDPLLLFLAAYLHSSAGEDAVAAAYARRLQAAAKADDTVLQSYARYVLTGRRLAEAAPANK